MRVLFIFCSLFLFILFSCTKNEDVQVYDSPKEVVNEPSATSEMPKMVDTAVENSTITKNRFKWSIPEGWQETVKGTMRVASFILPSKNKDQTKNVDLSLVVLNGEAGGITSNINRWRGQLELAALDEASILKELEKVKGKLGIFNYIFIKNNSKQEGMLAAMVLVNENTLFVKAVGSIETLELHKNAFIQFIKGIHVEK